MAAQIIDIHSKNPEARKIDMVIDALKSNGVILYPTDTGFTLGCDLSNKTAIEKLRLIRGINKDHALTFLCDSLSRISEFAQVDNVAYRTIKALVPGPYTFILPASKNVPNFVQNPKRNTAGIRVPNHTLSQALLKALGHPLVSISAKTKDQEYHIPEEIVEYFSKQCDLVVTSDVYNFLGESTVLDLSQDDYQIVREGAGINNVKQLVY